ncbi:hypothetical protein SAMN04488522_102381 [Pedobacter caeni]|uniref:Uncharacterized protein n=1 Tax=Pedobacter caeni TaxID=288992 RepID=A0A1M4ZLU8_9SPHI|nr:hypothetical protein SAMN04488522_102381 [Pedobacter caeni]
MAEADKNADERRKFTGKKKSENNIAIQLAGPIRTLSSFPKK